jgi:phage terminase large subunit-like protein
VTTLAPPAPVAIGPTWQRNGDGKWLLPKHTLGWQVLGWTADYLLQPDGPKAGEAWKFTAEQMRFILWWYAIDDQGRFIYRYGMLRRMKGWGKNPLADALAVIELLGPCRFSGEWDAEGQPIGRPHYASWVQMAAVSRDQTRNSMALLPAMISKEAINEFEIDIGKEIVYAHRGRCRLEAVTSSPRALEGGRATFIVMDETQHWLRSNEGHAMADVIARNAAKSRDGSSRVLAISNAHAPGEDSVAQHDYEAWQKISQGLSSATGVLYDSLEAPEDTDLLDDESLRAGLEAARGDSDWVSPERLMEEIHDPRTSPAIARRFYLNQIVAQEDKPFDGKRWAELERLGYIVPDGALIALGFDGSIGRDHTALIGTEIITGHQWVVGYWEPEILDSGEARIPFREVDETVDAAFTRWKVWRMNADPFYWKDMLAAWAGRYGADRVVAWATNQYRKMAASLLAYRNAIQTGALTHDGDPRFTAGILNSHKHMQYFRDDQGNPMWTIQKERPDSPLKIDAAMASCLSWEACTVAVAEGASASEEEASVMFV